MMSGGKCRLHDQSASVATEVIGIVQIKSSRMVDYSRWRASFVRPQIVSLDIIEADDDDDTRVKIYLSVAAITGGRSGGLSRVYLWRQTEALPAAAAAAAHMSRCGR